MRLLISGVLSVMISAVATYLLRAALNPGATPGSQSNGQANGGATVVVICPILVGNSPLTFGPYLPGRAKRRRPWRR